ncbi:MAG TPA: alpha/beta fold hydrolase [Acidimicrobiales bacterium]|nr:alpha/beta fold hydrolase [Acidimicrobiales bacterium]
MAANLRDVAGPIAWRDAGSGPDTIVLLHGLGGSRTAWDPQLRSLSDRWRAVAWDMPGYGASAPLPRPTTFAALADAVARLLDALGVERAHLVGWSLGGMVAMHTALAHPDRVDRLVLIATSPAFGLDGTDPDEWRRLRLDRLDAGETPADMARAVLTSVAGPRLSGPALADQMAAMARIPAAGLRAMVETLPHHDVRTRLADITAPTLVVVGELDHETPPAYARAIADAVPGARLIVLPGLGHLAPAEDPDTVSAVIRSFLDDRPAHHPDRAPGGAP